ncbi:MAG: nitronate monooxygenase [Calditrichales bacterium]|nr:nitronate monooxygenase [Calditrichales bacterium]
MTFKEMPQLRIGNLVIDKPIIQGGMGVGISLSGLASAVANEGGIGVISSVALGLLDQDKQMSFKDANIHVLKNEIKKAREQTNGVIGLNIMVAMTDYNNLLECAIEEEIDLVFVGAGLPLRFPKSFSLDKIKEIKTHFVPIVSSARAAQIIFQYWEKSFGIIPDAVVVEGPLAGGHLGFKTSQINDPNYKLEKIIPGVIEVIKTFEERLNKEIPVIAAGGIFSGADILKYLEMGAKGFQMGTRFVATHECDAWDEFKQAYINCKKEDITIIESPVGLPGRAIRNKFLEDVSGGVKKPFKCPWKCLKTCDFRNTPYCIADALTNAQKGNLEAGFAFAGANAYKVNKIISVKELFETLQQEYAAASMSEALV